MCRWDCPSGFSEMPASSASDKNNHVLSNAHVPSSANVTKALWMGWMKPYEYWDKPQTNRIILSIHSVTRQPLFCACLTRARKRSVDHGTCFCPMNCSSLLAKNLSTCYSQITRLGACVEAVASGLRASGVSVLVIPLPVFFFFFFFFFFFYEGSG